jgi:hypothetical protein
VNLKRRIATSILKIQLGLASLSGGLLANGRMLQNRRHLRNSARMSNVLIFLSRQAAENKS